MRWVDSVFRLFESWIDPFSRRDDYEPPNRLLSYVWYYVRQAKWAFFALLIYGLLNAIVEAAIFTFIGEIVDILTSFESSPLKAQGWDGLLAAHGTGLLLMLLTVLLIRSAVVIFGALIEEQVIVAGFFTLMRWQSHKHVIAQSLTFFQNDLAGRISQKVAQSGMATGDMMLSLLQVIWFIIVYAFTTAGLLAALDPRLGLVVGVWMVAFYMIAQYFVPKVRNHGRMVAESGSVAAGRMVDAYTNVQTVKIFASKSNQDDWVYEGIHGQYEALKKFTRTLTAVRAVLSITNGIAISAIGFLSISFWLNGTISLGQVAFALALVMRMHLLFGRLMGNLNGFFRNVGTTQNTMELVARPLGLTDAASAKTFIFKGGEIKFENVKFYYEEKHRLFENINLTVRPGERVGLVGPSGAGKTTLANLMLRFFEVEHGRVLVDGQDVNTVTQDSLRSCFSMVQQEAALFHRSVHDNIAYGKPEATREQVEEAARRAHAHDFIQQLIDQQGRKDYDARVGERGIKLSGGQRQRIAIARIFLRDAPILILDEATSQLDSEVEAAIQENLFNLMENKTVVAIAHRLSTISQLDRIIVIDNGKILEQGTHEELVRNGSLYADLWERQSGGFIALN